MYEILTRSHSGLRWVVLVLLIAAIAKSIGGISSGRAFNEGDRKLVLFSMVVLHVQLILGLIMYFMSPNVEAALADMGEAMKRPMLRFVAVEHITMMILAIAIVTFGYSRAKRAADSVSKFRRIAIFYTIGLILILAAIPWPFRAEEIAKPWF